MAMKILTAEQKQALTTMRERMGGISEEKKQHAKQLKAARKAITKLLGEKPATVPQIAAALSMASDEALWHITGMRKYGLVAETGEEDDYVLYALIANQEDAAAAH
jgi:predicted transcriptional regulator